MTKAAWHLHLTALVLINSLVIDFAKMWVCHSDASTAVALVIALARPHSLWADFFTRLIKNPVTRITKKYFAIGILVAYIYRLTHRPIRDVKGQPFVIQTNDSS